MKEFAELTPGSLRKALENHVSKVGRLLFRNCSLEENKDLKAGILPDWPGEDELRSVDLAMHETQEAREFHIWS